MSADLSYWAKSNPGVAFEETRKQFFGKFLIKVAYEFQSACYINKAKPGKMQEYINWRNLQATIRTGSFSVGYNPYWTRDHNANTNVDLLEHFSDIKRKHDQLKYRIESRQFGVYSSDENLLKAFNDAIDPAYKHCLHTVTSPRDSQHSDLLTNGHLLSAKKSQYKYKVMLRDGKYDPVAKQQLLNYFDSLDDMVKLPKSVRTNIEKGYAYTWGSYIYTTDLSILSFVSLIVPGIVGTTHEITKI